jgi:exopolyphosphatase/guanosine-5'-triphosphate,3'-diphosphate pyrophosphatase
MTHEGRLGVIDIGSNSIRLVVYDALKRTPLPLFNEKVFCGLGKGLATTGKLNSEGRALAETSIARFLTLVHIMDVVELQILATAAVRDAQDGAAFVEALERKFNIDITVISGKKEARLAAAGVLSSIYKPEGLAGDLGGGSIELIGLENGSMAEQATLPIGPLRLMDTSRGDRDKMKRMIADAMDAERWLEKTHPPHFYAIGGSFRALAHIHMASTKYPLDIVHHYAIKNGPLRKLLKDVLGASPQELAKMWRHWFLPHWCWNMCSMLPSRSMWCFPPAVSAKDIYMRNYRLTCAPKILSLPPPPIWPAKMAGCRALPMNCLTG